MLFCVFCGEKEIGEKYYIFYSPDKAGNTRNIEYLTSNNNLFDLKILKTHQL